MSSSSAIPVIDFGKWESGGEGRIQIAKTLAEACRRVGFVYVVNHGVDDELLDEAFAWSKKLFDLPEEKKMLAPHPPGMLHNSRTSSTVLIDFSSARPQCSQRLFLARA